jgi:hypothetical protein
MLFRLAAVLLLISTTAGCGQFGVAGPGDLGLEAKLTSPAGDLLVVSDPSLLTAPDPYNRTRRNAILSRWLIRSDNLCGNYQLQLSRAIRDSRLGTDVLATILSGLATILAPAATKTALAGAATMTLGVGGAIQSDLFMQQAGEVVSTAIQAVRTRARNDLEKKFQAPYALYTLEQGLVDVQRYDRETCSLNVGLNEIRASLNLGGAAASQVNSPIVPLPPQLPFGAEFAGAPPPPPAAMATTIVPPITTNLPGGGVAIIPGKVISTPVSPPVVTPPPPPVVLAPPPPVAFPPGPGTTRPRDHGPTRRGPRAERNVQAELSTAIRRITSLLPDPTQRAAVLDRCRLPKEAMAAAALTDAAKADVTRCLNAHVTVPVIKEPEQPQVFLGTAIEKLRPLPVEEQKRRSQKCLESEGFPAGTLVSDLLTGQLTDAQKPKVTALATCLGNP